MNVVHWGYYENNHWFGNVFLYCWNAPVGFGGPFDIFRIWTALGAGWQRLNLFFFLLTIVWNCQFGRELKVAGHNTHHHHNNANELRLLMPGGEQWLVLRPREFRILLIQDTNSLQQEEGKARHWTWCSEILVADGNVLRYRKSWALKMKCHENTGECVKTLLESKSQQKITASD